MDEKQEGQKDGGRVSEGRVTESGGERLGPGATFGNILPPAPAGVVQRRRADLVVYQVGIERRRDDDRQPDVQHDLSRDHPMGMVRREIQDIGEIKNWSQLFQYLSKHRLQSDYRQYRGSRTDSIRGCALPGADGCSTPDFTVSA